MDHTFEEEYPSGKGGRFQKKSKKRKGLAVLRWILIALLALLAAAVIAIVIFVNAKLNQINRPDQSETWLTPEQAASIPDETDLPMGSEEPGGAVTEPDITWPSEEDEMLLGEEDEIINILLIGQDRRPGEARARSDSMILISVNKDTDKISMVSFLRDNYVQIPGGYRDNRLNVAYSYGGMELLDEALAVNFGIYVDANIEVDFSGFQKIIDLLGGVNIYLTQAEAEYINGGVTAGMNHLNGELALCYSRIRKLDSDFGRTNRQRNVLNSLMNSFQNISLSRALELVDTIFPMVTTDMTNSELISYVTEILPIFKASSEINSFSIPQEGEYYDATIRSMMVLVPDLSACRQRLIDELR